MTVRSEVLIGFALQLLVSWDIKFTFIMHKNILMKTATYHTPLFYPSDYPDVEAVA